MCVLPEVSAPDRKVNAGYYEDRPLSLLLYRFVFGAHRLALALKVAARGTANTSGNSPWSAASYFLARPWLPWVLSLLCC